jgi:hypothetical protein
MPSPEWTLSGITLKDALERISSESGNFSGRWANKKPDSPSSSLMHAGKFIALMTALKKSNDSADITEFLKEYGPPPVRRFLRRLFGAY